MDWMELAALLINGVGVVAIVQYLKNIGMGWLRVNVPWALPIIAMFAAQLLNAAAVYVGGLLGYPIDFSPIIAVLTGALAIAAYDIKHGVTVAKRNRF